MHAAIQLAAYWALAFLSLGAAVALLNIFFNLIGNNLELRSMGKEAVIAGIASLIEAASLWLVISFIPLASGAMLIPAIIVALIYKITHLECWNHYDIIMLLTFQVVISFFGMMLILGHFLAAIIILVGFIIILAVIASFVRSL